MLSAGPARLTDDYWLAAHDGVNGACVIGEWPLGVGLATGLLAELVFGKHVELHNGELFRTNAKTPDDPALGPVLTRMENEEQAQRPVPPPAPAWQQVHSDPRQPPVARYSWTHPSPAPQENRHSKPGHDLGTWIAFLARQRRAELLVGDRLARTGLAYRLQHRRLFGGTTVRYEARDSADTGTPATTIRIAGQRYLAHALDWSGLFLAALFFATGVHHHALDTLSSAQRSHLMEQIGNRLDNTSSELLLAAETAVAARTAMR
jgi:hypothetical protein